MLVPVMIMLRSADGKRSVSSKYIKSMRITSDVDEVMLRIVAYVEGDAPVVLRQVNTFEVAGAWPYIRRQLELIEEELMQHG